MNEITHLPIVLQELVQALENHLDQLTPNRKRTLPVKIKKQNQNTIITWNIYSEPQKEITGIFSDLQKIISQILEQPLDGELIYFEIKKGNSMGSLIHLVEYISHENLYRS